MLWILFERLGRNKCSWSAFDAPSSFFMTKVDFRRGWFFLIHSSHQCLITRRDPIDLSEYFIRHIALQNNKNFSATSIMLVAFVIIPLLPISIELSEMQLYNDTLPFSYLAVFSTFRSFLILTIISFYLNGSSSNIAELSLSASICTSPPTAWSTFTNGTSITNMWSWKYLHPFPMTLREFCQISLWRSVHSRNKHPTTSKNEFIVRLCSLISMNSLN